MGLLEPVYDAINNILNGTIAGGGAVAGDTIAGVGSIITATGEDIGDRVAGTARNWGDYAKDTGNHVKDYTKAPGPRASTAANPLGLGGNGKTMRIPYPLTDPNMGQRAPAARKQVTTSPTPAMFLEPRPSDAPKSVPTPPKPTSTAASRRIPAPANSISTGAVKPTRVVSKSDRNQLDVAGPMERRQGARQVRQVRHRPRY